MLNISNQGKLMVSRLPYILPKHVHRCIINKCEISYFCDLGWFWSGSGARISPTNSTPPGWPRSPWSHTGYIGQFLSKYNWVIIH